MFTPSLAALLLVATPALQVFSPQASAPALHPPGTAFTELYHVAGTHAGDDLGYAACGLPDLDADGVEDILVGLPNRNAPVPTNGHAWVLSGRTGAVLREHAGLEKGDRFGRVVSRFPDLDQDGVHEYAVGATWAYDPLFNEAVDHPGSATILSGATGEELLVLGGYVSGECFGGGLAELNDVTGDGLPDFAIGSRFGGAVDGDPLTAPGKVRIFSGALAQPVFEVSGAFPGDFLAGEATIPIGDLDGDGATDVVSGAWGYPNNAKQGQVLVISGATGAVILAVDGEQPGDRFGWSLAALPDVDGDGLPDLLVGAPYAGHHARGRAYVVSTAGGTVLKILQGQGQAERYGTALGAVGDRDGDGVADLAIGAPGHAQSRGRVDLVSGATGAVLGSATGSTLHEQFGHEVQPLPDLDGDGLGELGVGAVRWPSGLGYGRLTVFSLGG